MHDELFEGQRERLFRIAYAMLGTVMDAEDVVQDAYIRWASVDPASVESPSAFLRTVTTRLALDRLRRLKRAREQYVGPWLPDPFVSGFDTGFTPVPDPTSRLQLSTALLVALETLQPVHRAVLVLRDVFDFEYHEIADVVDKSPSNCRQIARRARQRAGAAASAEAKPSAGEARRILESYVDAIQNADVEGVVKLFREDVTLRADGGGKVAAVRKVTEGSAEVARRLVAVAPMLPPDAELRFVWASGDPGIAATVAGRHIAVISFDVRQGAIVAVHVLLNPEKLARLD